MIFLSTFVDSIVDSINVFDSRLPGVDIFAENFAQSTVKPFFKRPLKINKTKILMTTVSLMHA